MSPIEIKWSKDELVSYVSNLSAFVAQTLSLDGSVAFDINTLTNDNRETFLHEEISEAVSQLIPHFSRIINNDADVINDTNVGFNFTPRIEGGSYSKAELSHIKTLSRKLVASYILADWYTVKGVASMSNYFATQYSQTGVELNRVLDGFVRPTRKAGIHINRVTYSTKPSQNLVHINNKSDFVLVWSSKDGSALPNGEFDIDFFTDGDVVYSVNSLDTQCVKPIEGEDSKVRIIFDFSREGASYFANGVLKYNMYGEATDSDFPDGKRHYEISGETNIEIWSGASDTDGDMFASYVPLYAKLTFEDLTEEDIAVLQTPALEAANTANASAQYANAMAQFASVQGNAASNAAIQANSAIVDARDAIEEVEKTNDTIKTAESERIKQWDNLSETINDAIDSAYQNSFAANTAAGKAEKAYEDVTALADEITEAEKLREQNTTAAVEAANTAAERANEIADGIQDDLAKKADIDKSYPKMTAGFAQEIVGDGSATPEEFSFRSTAGLVRINGAAQIQVIKGNSEVKDGVIVNGNYRAIKTTGFNQWDEQWELGGINTAAGKPFANNTRIRSKNFNSVLPNTPYVFSMSTLKERMIFWYDDNYQFISYNFYQPSFSSYKISPSNARYFKILLYDTYGTTYKNDICINLARDEYAHLNGTYKPYKPFEMDLSWISKYFPNGMRSAGSEPNGIVRDEIRFNSSTQKWEAIQRVDVRAYESGDESDGAVTTDGINTNYAITTPTYKEIIENVNLIYRVSNKGTEELLSDNSSSFVADIAYPVSENAMQGAVLSVNGDSICYGAGYSGGYAGIIAKRFDMAVQNIAVGGATIISGDDTRHRICNTISNMREDADYAILEGGVNDAALKVTLGEISDGYSATLDTTTFYGAFEYALKQLISRFAGKKYGYIAVHQMVNGFRIVDNEATSYYWAARKCCEKWGVPFCDLNDKVPAFEYIPELASIYTQDGDGWHPNEEGYKKYYIDKIVAWMKTL